VDVGRGCFVVLPLGPVPGRARSRLGLRARLGRARNLPLKIVAASPSEFDCRVDGDVHRVALSQLWLAPLHARPPATTGRIHEGRTRRATPGAAACRSPRGLDRRTMLTHSTKENLRPC
jgi:hypothetical protein